MAYKATSDDLKESGYEDLVSVQLEEHCNVTMISGTLFGMGNYHFNCNKKYLLHGNSNSKLCDDLCNTLKIAGARDTLADACCTGLNIVKNACYLIQSKKADVICVASELLTEYLPCVMGQLRVLAKDEISRAMKQAVQKAQIELNQIQYINAHGNSTAVSGKAEAAAINLLFGEYAKKMRRK